MYANPTVEKKVSVSTTVHWAWTSLEWHEPEHPDFWSRSNLSTWPTMEFGRRWKRVWGPRCFLIDWSYMEVKFWKGWNWYIMFLRKKWKDGEDATTVGYWSLGSGCLPFGSAECNRRHQFNASQLQIFTKKLKACKHTLKALRTKIVRVTKMQLKCGTQKAEKQFRFWVRALWNSWLCIHHWWIVFPIPNLHMSSINPYHLWSKNLSVTVVRAGIGDLKRCR